MADNRLALNAGWDDELLRLELAALSEDAFDLNLLGFDEGELANLLNDPTDGLTDEDAIPDVQPDPIARPGDLFVLGNHRLICGDCTKAEVVALPLGDAKPHLLVTDPPYGIELDSEWRDRAGLNGSWSRATELYEKTHRGTP